MRISVRELLLATTSMVVSLAIVTTGPDWLIYTWALLTVVWLVVAYRKSPR